MEINDKEFEILLAEKKHKEVISILTSILKELSQDKEINIKNDIDITKLENILSKLSFPDYSDIPKSIKVMGENIIKKINTKPKTWIHTVERDKDGLIKTVISNSK